MTRRVSRRLTRPLALAGCALVASTVLAAGPARASIPPGVDPGTPTFGGLANPVPAEPGGAYDPTRSRLQAIFDADVAAGGTSYWLDRMLARPFSNAAGETSLFTRGRALYMYTHVPGTLGFAGGYAYRERPTGASQNLYTLSLSGGAVSEATAQRVQFPSYFSAVFNRADGLSVAEKKFITDNDVAVTSLTLANTGSAPLSTTVTASSPIATTASADGTELTGTVSVRYALTTIFPRLSGDGFAAAGGSLTRSVSLNPGASVTFKVQLGALANELPQSATDYQRYRGLDADTAWRTQMKEYNKFFVDNVPYVDLPDKNVEKVSWYRTWENHFNMFDGNIPGNDYQFPADLEGALGYNNQISLTVPMRMQDLQYYRDPLYSYGPWLSQGEESGCQSFHDNPGNTANWNNTYEQWTAAQAWQSYLVHGGPSAIVGNLARYSECDVKGTLAKFDTNHNNLIEYTSGTLPGNDADSVAFKYYGTGSQGVEDRTESSFWYAGARAAAAEYTMVGNSAKAAEMNTIADNIKNAILNTLWAGGQVTNAPVGASNCNATGARVAGRLGNALKLCGSAEYASLPAGIVSGLSDFTVSAWVNPASTATWSRVFDFGTGTNVYMFLTVNAGGGPRFAMTTGGGGAEQQISATGQLPLSTWTHLAVTLSGSTGTLYVNGNPVATNTAMSLKPSSLGNTTNNWIGRSQYADPFLSAAVDDFQIYNRALSSTEVSALAGGQAGAGNVASYRFDEANGATIVDSSGAGHAGTVISQAKPTVTCPGGVFLQKHIPTQNLVCWKDQQNFTPFIDGVAPNTDQFKQALRYYADKNEFGIMPIYTADQADFNAALACGPCDHGSNNFSNINATLQARLYSKALRDYPSQFITGDMYRKLIEWLSWNEYINGDNRFPDNNEFFFNWDPATQTLGRSGIHHDVLGSFNWMFYEDVAGLRARADNVLEMYPIDIGYDHFTVNNLSYHGSNLTVVWQKPGGPTFYPMAPAGYSVYLDGKRIFTVNAPAHLSWNSATGAVTILDGSGAQVQSSASAPLAAANGVSLSANSRMTDAFQKAGLDLSGGPGSAADLARGKTASASFTTTSPAAQATSAANAVDGSTTSGLPVTQGSYVGTNPIWGDAGSPNASDTLAVDFGTATRLNDVRVYFYSNKAFGAGGNTYREPASYSVQMLQGSTWVSIPGQTRSPAVAAPNYNRIDFPPVVARQIRVVVTRMSGFGVGVKELQAFDLESVADQVSDVKSFVGALPVPGGVRNALTVKLTQTGALYRAGKPDQAADALSGLVDQVNGLTAGGMLDPDQSDTLLGTADAITAHMNE